MATEYFELHDSHYLNTKPRGVYGLVRMNTSNGRLERLIPDAEGYPAGQWYHNPTIADEIVGGEPGARGPIAAAEAERLIASGQLIRIDPRHIVPGGWGVDQ